MLCGPLRSRSRRPHDPGMRGFRCVIAVPWAVTAMVAMAGCGQSSAQQSADNIRAYLGAKSVQQIQCTDEGTNGSGQSLRSCDVTFTEQNGCQRAVTTVEVQGNSVAANQNPTIAANTQNPGCSSP